MLYKFVKIIREYPGIFLNILDLDPELKTEARNLLSDILNKYTDKLSQISSANLLYQIFTGKI